ncbi:MAG: DUF4345 family protein [Hyphomonas sp.]
MLIRIFLALIALMFAAFGLWSLLQPLTMAASLGVEVGGPNGAYEMRGIYGGVSLAAALLCAAGAATPGLREPALWFLVTYFGGYIFARAAALLLGPPPTASFAGFIAFETIGLLLAVVALRAARRP